MFINKFSLFLATILLPAVTLAQTNDRYTLTGKIGNLSAPAKIYLMQLTETGLSNDSTNLNNGNFTFKGALSEPRLAYLIIDRTGEGNMQLDEGADALSMYLEKGNIGIQSTDSAKKATITGSQLNNDNKTLKDAIHPSAQKLDQFIKKVNNISPEKQREAETKNKLMAEYKSLLDDYKLAVSKFIKTHKDSYVSLFTLLAMSGQTPETAELDELYDSLSPKLQQSKPGLSLKAVLDANRGTAVGSIAPDFSQADINGKQVALSSFRGKYVLIDFWASWCGPCRQQNPVLVDAYNKYKNKNFTILGVSLDKAVGRNAWLKAIKDDNLTWTQVSDLKAWQNEAAVLYKVKAIPQNFLIDPSGKIIAKNLYGEELDAKLEELLGKI